MKLIQFLQLVICVIAFSSSVTDAEKIGGLGMPKNEKSPRKLKLRRRLKKSRKATKSKKKDPMF